MTASAEFLKALRSVVGREHVLHKPEDLLVYELDGTIDRSLPEAVVFPGRHGGGAGGGAHLQRPRDTGHATRGRAPD